MLLRPEGSHPRRAALYAATLTFSRPPTPVIGLHATEPAAETTGQQAR
jgi:hypothetical protein